jgi:Mor family transcriptional regulator
MKYLNAASILPEELVNELQKYVEGNYLYIPSKKRNRKKWGECSGSRMEFKKRNQKIREEFTTGTSMEQLSETYYLSIHAIRKIIYSK